MNKRLQQANAVYRERLRTELRKAIGEAVAGAKDPAQRRSFVIGWLLGQADFPYSERVDLLRAMGIDG